MYGRWTGNDTQRNGENFGRPSSSNSGIAQERCQHIAVASAAVRLINSSSYGGRKRAPMSRILSHHYWLAPAKWSKPVAKICAQLVIKKKEWCAIILRDVRCQGRVTAAVRKQPQRLRWPRLVQEGISPWECAPGQPGIYPQSPRYPGLVRSRRRRCAWQASMGALKNTSN